MTNVKHNNSGTVAVTLVLLLIVTAIILSIVRHFWVDSTNDYFNELISVYIMENENLKETDRDRLRSQLLEDGLFIKMHLYDEMIITRDKRQMRIEEQEGSVVETMINL